MLIALLILIAAAAVISLVSGAAYLEVPLPGGLPIGNALTAVGQCSAAAAAVGLSRPDSLLRRVSVSSLVAASLWLPVSIALAGNLTLNFSGSRGLVWMALTLITGFAVLFSLVWALVRCLLIHSSKVVRRHAGMGDR